MGPHLGTQPPIWAFSAWTLNISSPRNLHSIGRAPKLPLSGVPYAVDYYCKCAAGRRDHRKRAARGRCAEASAAVVPLRGTTTACVASYTLREACCLTCTFSRVAAITGPAKPPRTALSWSETHHVGTTRRRAGQRAYGIPGRPAGQDAVNTRCRCGCWVKHDLKYVDCVENGVVGHGGGR